MGSISAKMDVSKELDVFIAEFGKRLVREALPRAMDSLNTVIMPAIIARLPDGDAPTAEGPPSRLKQTKEVRDKYNKKMKNSVTFKTIKDAAGVLRIYGVDSDAGQVNFDFGKKAKSVGRKHVLWWPKDRKVVHVRGFPRTIGGEPQRLRKKAPYRKQMQDIPAQVAAEVETRVVAAFVNEIDRLLSG